MVSIHLKHISQIGHLPKVGMKITNIWNHHLVTLCLGCIFGQPSCEKLAKSEELFFEDCRPVTFKHIRKSNGNKTHKQHEPWNPDWLIGILLFAYEIIPIKLDNKIPYIQQITRVNASQLTTFKDLSGIDGWWWKPKRFKHLWNSWPRMDLLRCWWQKGTQNVLSNGRPWCWWIPW